ncbi:hypothetical protein [Companilactobacillus halodurans]|uniref:Uncharacterized protein n=1 Tax=Companilactobacillus halodurans TaxID=2584183 RepID=A0A5P0ZM79_9LACO|nr:hypothetical protein [Companilactobacillus halodurans]MQS75317.1 hypothetical protein [Companilactobacillus halodurans]MQS98574.1 hypothetical protein [Companilactobacillus halodurans]
MNNNGDLKKKGKSSTEKVIIGLLVIAIFVALKIGLGNLNFFNPMPSGLSNTDKIMTYLGENKKSNEQISMTSMMSQLNYSNYRDIQERLQTDPVIFVMKNKDTGRYVFKYKDHYVYLIKEITDFYQDDSYKYIYFVASIKKSSDGKQYVKEVNTKKYDDSNAKETDGYSIQDYNNYYGTDDN